MGRRIVDKSQKSGWSKMTFFVLIILTFLDGNENFCKWSKVARRYKNLERCGYGRF